MVPFQEIDPDRALEELILEYISGPEPVALRLIRDTFSFPSGSSGYDGLVQWPNTGTRDGLDGGEEVLLRLTGVGPKDFLFMNEGGQEQFFAATLVHLGSGESVRWYGAGDFVPEPSTAATLILLASTLLGRRRSYR